MLSPSSLVHIFSIFYQNIHDYILEVRAGALDKNWYQNWWRNMQAVHTLFNYKSVCISIIIKIQIIEPYIWN